jgi:hypothetical protein
MIVDGNNIYLIRGDTANITVAATEDDVEKTPIKFVTGVDKVYFTVKTGPTTSDKLIQKVITTFDVTGVAVVKLVPSDTKPLSYREYKYDIQWSKVSDPDEVHTLVPMASFFIKEEVTFE